MNNYRDRLNKAVGSSTTEWQKHEDPAMREKIPEMSSSDKQGALSSLAGKTKTSVINGETHYLLHRGMGSKEFRSATSRPEKGILHGGVSSWTPNLKQAKEFAGRYAESDSIEHGMSHKPHLTSAWVPESKIKNILGGSDKVYNQEHEVLVHPEHYSKPYVSIKAQKPPMQKSDHTYRNRLKKAKEKKSEESLTKGDNGIIPVGTRPTSGVKKQPMQPKDKTVKVARANVNLLNVPGVSMSLGKSDGSDLDTQEAKNHIKKNAHLYNGAKLHSAGHTKEDATNKVREMRSQNIHASMTHVSGPKTGPKSKHAILVPDTDGLSKSEDLEKGLNGDWQKEGYKIVQAPARARLNPKKNGFRLHALDIDGNRIGEVHVWHDGENIFSANSHIDLKHRRKGLASSMYRVAEEMSGKPMRPSTEQEPDAKKLWDSKVMQKSERLAKDVINLKDRKPKSKDDKVAAKRAFFEDLKSKSNHPQIPDTRSRDDKINSAFDRQIGQGSGIMDQPSAQDKMNDLKIRQHEVRQKKTKKDKEHEAQLAYENMSPYDKMKSIHAESNPDSHKFILENESKQASEPYYGHEGMSGLEGYSANSKHPQAFPHMNVDPKGVLGKEVSDFGHDPFMWMDTKYGATKKVLQEHKDKPLDIHTRSDLVAHDDYMEHLQPGRHRIFMHSPSGNKAVNRIIQPGVASLQRQLKAASKLREAGHDVTMVHDSIPGFAQQYPQNGLSSMDFARAVKDHDPKLKISTNDIQPSEKSENFLKHARKILGGNSDEN